jgi:PleD family two-component response regulator
MSKAEPRKVLAVVSDLFFTVRIGEAAKRAGLAIEFVRDADEVAEKALAQPTLIIFDLSFDAVDPLALIARLKSNEDTRRVSLLGYVSHIDGELKQKAQEAGCNTVLAKSAFSQNLPTIFKRHAGIR